MDDPALQAREDERRKRREERERLKREEEEKWELERKKREEERIRRREARLRGEEPSGSPEVDKEKLVNDVISKEEERKRKELEDQKAKRSEEVKELVEARKKASIDAPEIQEPTTPRTKVDVQVEIKPRIESMEKKSRGEEEQTVKKTVDIKDQLHLDIKPKIEFMEKISSPRNNNEYTSPRNNSEHVSPRNNNETSPSKSNKELIQLADGKAEIKEIKDIVPSQETGVPNEVNEIDNKQEELLKQHKEQEEEELKRKEIEIELKRKQEEEEEIRKQEEIELKKQEQQKKEQHEKELKRKQEEEEEEEQQQQQQQELRRKEEQRKQEEEEESRKKKEEEELSKKEEEIEINKKREIEELNKKKLQQQQEENNKKEKEELKKREDEIKRKQIEDENNRKQKEQEEEKRKKQEQKEQQERKRKEEEEEINKKKREEEEIRIKKRREEEEKVKREIKEIQNKSIEQIEQTYLKRKEMEEINKKKELNKFNMNTEEQGEYYKEMTQLAREWSVTMTTPTFVIIGGQGHGKSTLIESIIGIPSISTHLSINVPIIFELIPDINATDVLYSVFDIDSNSILSLNSIKDLQTWILNTQNKINKTDITNVPSLHIYIKFNKFGFPIKFIDTPPLYNSSSQKENIKNELIIMDFIKDKNNTIIYVEDCNTYNNNSNNNDNNTLINGVDPQYERTIKIITKIDTLLIKNQQSIINLIDNISNKKKINNIFIVSLLNTNDRDSCKTIDDFRSKLGEKQVIDYKIIEKYDKSKQIENNYGISNIRKEILNKAWNKNKIVVPQIKREIIDKMKILKEKQKYYIEQNKIMNNTKQMRVFTFKYINQYLNTLEKIVEGSEKIRIPLQGQTTKEEIMEQSNTWDINISIITMNKIKEIQEEIPFSNSRLHGAQQLKRLLSEYQNIIESIKLPKDNEDIIITAAGLNHLHSSNNYAYAACEIATEHSNQLLKPLVFELANRSSYIIKRSCIAAQSIISEYSSFNSLPILSNYVSQLFQSFIDKMTLLFLQQIQSEFFDAKTLYWFTTTKKHRFISQGEELVDFTNELFQSIKEHITHKSLLLITNYLIFSILDRSHGLDEMLLHINSVSDQELSELFQVENNKVLADNEMKKIETQLNLLKDRQDVLDKKLFSWPSIK